MTTPDSTPPKKLEAPPEAERAPMVSWFDPAELMRTGLQVIISTMFGRSADRRVMDAVVHPLVVPCHSEVGEELWIDYVADTGDGWNSTYAVAHAASQPELELELEGGGEKFQTKRGRILVFGGDEVYPTPTRDEYKRRLVAPYETALPNFAESGHKVFAVPGNHDWYDSLVAFSRLFCSEKGRWIGARKTGQTLSYFAVKLPHDWWLMGVDLQLDSDIDEPQLKYFRELMAREKIPEDARIILCVAEPHWIFEALYATYDPTVSERNLDYLDRKVFGDRVAVYLAGDLHHYRRHATAGDWRQKITAGGGGAFLHPTHTDEEKLASVSDDFAFKTSFPTAAESRAVAWKYLGFSRLNPTFGLATAVVYLLIAWAAKADVGRLGITSIWEVIVTVTRAALNSQIAVLWAALILFGFYFFTDTHSKRYKRWGGLTHAVSHLLASFFIGWFALWFTISVIGLQPERIPQLVVTGIIIMVLGYLIGPMIMGIYLLVSLNVFGRHAGEFSALHHEDYKSWLRLHVTREGTLEIYPIGIRTVAKRWRENPSRSDASPSLLVPDDSAAIAPGLIEPPITVRRVFGQVAGS
ncbi:MAG: metallophosphoesterase [Gemmatimonadaceae bacterium]